MSFNKSNVVALVIGLILGAIFFGGSDSATSTPTPTASGLTPETRASHTVEMNNATKSEPIALVGDYSVDWESFAGDCEKTDVSLRAAWDTDYSFYGTVFNYDGYGQGTSYFYELDAGNYYLEPSGIWGDTCNWRATFNPMDLPK